MDSKNMVVLVGRLVADPELRFTAGGDAVANFALAVNRTTRKPDGSFEDSLDGFFDCEHFGKTAVTLAESCGKGSEVQVTGSLHQRKFKVGNGERTVSKISVRAKTIAPVLAPPKADPVAQPASAPVQQAVPQRA